MPHDFEEIVEGCTVIVQKGSYLKPCRIFPARSYKFGKRGEGQITLSFNGVIGNPFGSSFRMKFQNKRIFTLERIHGLVSAPDIEIASGSDNRDLKDDGCSQKLTKNEIYQLVDAGISGQQIIQTLAQNSTTFKGKTRFSQEKYMNKKQKKYGEIVTLHRPSIRLLADMYYAHEPLRISNLRIDSLAQLLCYANVQPGSPFAVFEAGTQGLVTAAMLHRLGRSGSLVHIFHGSQPQREAVDFMNFTPEELEILSYINVDDLPVGNSDHETMNRCSDGTREGDCISAKIVQDEEICIRNSIVDEDIESSLKVLEDGIEENAQGDEKNASSGPTVKFPKFVRRRAEDTKLSSSILLQGVAGLVVACRQHPSSVFLGLLRYLRLGCPFVVFSPYKEPLMELYMEIKARGGLIVRLSETWLRHYQVLSQRTHPEISMSGGGGYLLYGYHV